MCAPADRRRCVSLMIRNAMFITCVLVAYLLLLYVFQRSLLFPVPGGKLPDTLPPHVSKIELTEGHALFLRASPGTGEEKPLVFFTHGNAELAHWSIQPMSFFNNLGAHVVLLEYPGYGGASGKPARDSIRRASLEAYDVVTAMPGVDASRVVAYGRSIGGGPAVELARDRQVAALVLESTFSSLSKLVYEKWMPAFLLRDRYDNLGILAELEIPVFLYHGNQDVIIPAEHSRRLQAAAYDATFVEANCGHNNCPRPWQELRQFFSQKGIL